MSSPNWRIYYEDGTTFDSNDGRPEDSPDKGIMAIRQRWRCDSGHHESSPPLKPEPGAFGGALAANFYVYRYDVGEWMPVDFFGVLFQAKQHGPILAREGAMMPHDAWEKAWPTAANDPDFP